MIFASLLSTLAAPTFAGGVSHVVVNGDRITVEIEGTVQQATSLVLDTPQRIVLDVKGSTSGTHAVGDGIVSAVRMGQYAADTTRIVFDLDSPAIITNGHFSADGHSLSLSLAPASADRFALVAGVRRQTYPAPGGTHSDFVLPPRSRHSVTMPLGPAGAPLPRPHIYGPVGKPLVVIDAGHGGQDPGAINPATGQREKDITLATAKRIKDALLATGRVRVALTREDDHFIVLRERSAIAHNIHADLFMSIHADSEPGQDARGATVYTLSEVASDKEAQALAARENKADIVHGVNLNGENADVASILLDLAQRETMNQSTDFANLLKREGAGSIPFRSDYHRTAGFAVLKQPDMPSCLLEIGYISNPNDVSRIASPEGQAKIATGIRKAVEIHFAKQLASR
jgi:N-acetylmuramoyl-L-alanine amidase